MYLQIAQRSPLLIAAMNCVNTIVSTSTLPTINSWAKCLFNVASQIGLPSLPLTRRQTRSCAIPHATRSLTTARSSSVGTNGGLPTFLLEGSLFSLSFLFLMPSIHLANAISDQARRLLAFPYSSGDQSLGAPRRTRSYQPTNGRTQTVSA